MHIPGGGKPDPPAAQTGIPPSAPTAPAPMKSTRPRLPVHSLRSRREPCHHPPPLGKSGSTRNHEIGTTGKTKSGAPGVSRTFQAEHRRESSARLATLAVYRCSDRAPQRRETNGEWQRGGLEFRCFVDESTTHHSSPGARSASGMVGTRCRDRWINHPMPSSATNAQVAVA